MFGKKKLSDKSSVNAVESFNNLVDIERLRYWRYYVKGARDGWWKTVYELKDDVIEVRVSYFV